MTHGLDGNIRQSETVPAATVDWSLLSPQGHVLFYIALCPDSTVKGIARAIGHSERQIRSMIRNLADGGMIRRRTNQRSHHYTINFDAPMLHPTVEGLSLRSFMESAVEQLRSENPDICKEEQV